MELIWTLPVTTELRRAKAPAARDVRERNFGALDYAEQVTRAADAGGYDGVLVPFDPAGEDSWIAAASVARVSRRLQVVVEYPSTFGTPVYAAKMAATFQRFTHARLSVKLVVSEAAPRTTIPAAGEEILRRCAEYLEIGRGLWNGPGYDFAGEVFEVASSGLIPALRAYPAPPVVLTGDDPGVQALSARHGDLHLWELTEPDAIDGQVRSLAERAAEVGRTVRSGAQLAVLTRPCEEEAWADFRRIVDRSPGATRTSVGRHGPYATGLRGLGFTSSTGLIGSYAQVASELDRLGSAGVTTVVLEGRQHLEEAYRVAEFVRPELLSQHQPTPAVPA